MKNTENMSRFFSIANMLPLIIYLLIVCAGVIAHYMKIDWLEEFYGALDVAAAVALAMFAIWGYIEYSRQEESVKIVFAVNGQSIDTRLSFLRKNCTRSEVLGVLGMIQKDPKTRFEIASMKKAAFLDNLGQVQKGSAKELYIILTQSELEQFEMEE